MASIFKLLEHWKKMSDFVWTQKLEEFGAKPSALNFLVINGQRLQGRYAPENINDTILLDVDAFQ